MSDQRGLMGEQQLPEYSQNLAVMLNENAERFTDHAIFQDLINGTINALSWSEFKSSVISIQHALVGKGLATGDRVAILSPNRREMLQLELAVMAYGAVAVPIFAGYPAARADALVHYCEPKMLVVADQKQYDKLTIPESCQTVISFDPVKASGSRELLPFDTLLNQPSGETAIAGGDIAADAICLMMYTSGTTGKPKLVQLMHRNILSQQSAMRVMWKLSDKDRFLTYLPWHHSFGGIYEKYAAITNGAVLSLEHGFGKDVDLLLKNWALVRPTCFFSVPRIFQDILTLAAQDKQVEKIVFHDELRFVFTAAAPLAKNLSDMFESRGIPVYEGWGLTETSPCCTVTDPKIARAPGVVGKPIAGVALKLTEENEILVKGPNVMTGYYRNEAESAKVLLDDGWFATGDVGEITDAGLRLVSRKDRIFKLSNAEKVIPREIESLIARDCCYLSHVFVTGSGRDYPVVLLFPNKKMFSQMPDESLTTNGCVCPKGLGDLSNCLKTCLKRTAGSIEEKYSRPKAAMLIDRELSIENEELTPSMKLAPNVVAKVFKANIESIYGADKKLKDKVYVINLE